MAQHEFRDLKNKPLKLEVGPETRFYDSGNHRDIESPFDSGEYHKVLDTMDDVRAACAGTKPAAHKGK